MNVQTKKLEGRDHYVCPVVMIVEGVLNGSQGAVHYPGPVLEASARQWNGRPVVVYHPEQHGHGFADSPEVFNAQKIGTIFNTSFDGRKLTAEAWIDKSRVEAVDARVAAAIRQRTPLEVSTGVVVLTNEERTADGAAVAAALQPDHLAILPDRTGACSMTDGCGLLRNEAEEALELPVMAF